MKREQIKKTSVVFFALVTLTALSTISLITASQHASAAAHHKAHTASKDPSPNNVHKVLAVIPETHGASAPELLKIMKTTKGNAIGGMIVDGY